MIIILGSIFATIGCGRCIFALVAAMGSIPVALILLLNVWFPVHRLRIVFRLYHRHHLLIAG